MSSNPLQPGVIAPMFTWHGNFRLCLPLQYFHRSAGRLISCSHYALPHRTYLPNSRVFAPLVLFATDYMPHHSINQWISSINQHSTLNINGRLDMIKNARMPQNFYLCLFTVTFENPVPGQRCIYYTLPLPLLLLYRALSPRTPC